MADCGEAFVGGGEDALAVDSTALPLVPLEPDSLRLGSCTCLPEGNMNRRSPSHDGMILVVEAGGLPLAVVVLVGMTVGGVSFSTGT
jgi:hypothetical protein